MNTVSAGTSAPAALRLPLSLYPAIPRFALDAVSGVAGAREFLPASSAVRPREHSPAPELVDALIRSNLGWGNDVSAALRQWASEPVVTLIAGQQAGFGGGPLYTLAKIASLLNLRRQLAADGIRSVVFFWIATEDHDIAEVATLLLQTPRGIHRLSAPVPVANRCPVGNLEITRELVAAYRDAAGTSDEWLEEPTFGSSFARLLSDALSGQDVVLVDSLLPELRQSGAELFSRIASGTDALEAAIADRSRSLEAAGYTAQVKPSPDGHFSLLYYLDDDSQRQAIRCTGDSSRIGDRAVPREEILRLIASEPHRISTGALARPLLQDLVFAPGVFVGGPAEVSYYAQLAPLHEALGITPPQVALRGHALVATERILRAIDRYSIPPALLFEGADRMIGHTETARLQRLREASAAAREKLELSVAAIQQIVAEANGTFGKSAQRTLRHLRYHNEKLEQRATAAVIRADADRYNAISRLASTLTPDGQPQDRVAGWIGWWNVFGSLLVERLIDSSVAGSDTFAIATL